jgi:hypothetical protein
LVVYSQTDGNRVAGRPHVVLYATVKISPLRGKVEKGHGPATSSHGGFHPKGSQPFWVQFPDIYTTKVVFRKDTLPDGIILPPVATAPCLKMSRPSAETKIPLA